MPVTTPPAPTIAPINAIIATINNPNDTPRSFVRLGLGLHANATPNATIAPVAGAEGRPGFPASAGNRAHIDCFQLTPNGAGTDFRLELPYSPEILAQSCDFRKAILPISSLQPVLKPLPGAVPLTNPVDIAERAAFDYAITLGGVPRTKVEPLNGKVSIVILGNIPNMMIAELLADGGSQEVY
jgi:hypothetical protein